MFFKQLLLWAFTNIFLPTPGPSLFPSSFKTCNRRQNDFNQCLVEAAQIGARQLTRPFREIGLPSLRSVYVQNLTVSPGKTVGFEQNYDDLRFFGFPNVTFTKFEVNFEDQQIVMECVFPEVTMDFDYRFRGKILEMDFRGDGHGAITFINLQFSFIFDLEEYQNRGQNFYRIKDSNLSMDTELIRSHFDNLFDGHEELKAKYNTEINKNWRPIFLDVRSKYEDIFEQIFTDIFGDFLKRVPISELFGE